MPGTLWLQCLTQLSNQTMPEKAYMYGLPYEYYEKYKVRRYGFHGTKPQFRVQKSGGSNGKTARGAEDNRMPPWKRLSVSAVLGGKSVDTSMGLTPLEGLVMGTRSGILIRLSWNLSQRKKDWTLQVS